MTDTDFAALIEPVARHLWGDPNPKLSTKNELRWGGQGSRAVFLDGPGNWKDFEAGEGGGVIDLVMRHIACDKAGAIEWLELEGFIKKRDPASKQPSGRPEAPPPTEEPPADDRPPQGVPEDEEEPFAVTGYTYTDRDGVVQYQVVRMHFRRPDGSLVIDPKTGNPKKTFRQRHRDASGEVKWGLGDRPHCLYRWPEIEQAAEAGRPIFVCEGEKDVHTLLDMGLDATTNSGGAKNWRPEFNASFKAADVVILVDNDEPGRERGTLLTEALSGVAASVKVVDLSRYWAGAPAKADVTDWVERGGGTKDALLDIVEGKVRPLPPRSAFGAKRTTEFAGKPIVYDWLVKGLIERGGILMFAGEKQAGKSFAVMDLGGKIARGIPYGDRKTRQGVVIHMACEDGKGTQMRWEGYRRHNQIPEDMELPYVIMDPASPGARAFTLMSDESVDAFIAECRAWGEYYNGRLELIIIDTLSIATEGLNEIDGAEVGKVLARVFRIRDRTGATVCLVHHLNAAGTRARGHSSIEANIPNVIEIRPLMTIPQYRREQPRPIVDAEGRHIRQMILTKNKNGLNMLKWRCVLKVVELGLDADGDPITTCIVDRPAKGSGASEGESRGSMSPDQKLVYDALVAAQSDDAAPRPDGCSAPPQIKTCVPAAAFIGRVRKAMNFTADEVEVEARNKELSAFLKRTTTGLINGGFMGRDNDCRVVWWTGKSDRPRHVDRPADPAPRESLAHLTEDDRKAMTEPPF